MPGPTEIHTPRKLESGAVSGVAWPAHTLTPAERGCLAHAFQPHALLISHRPLPVSVLLTQFTMRKEAADWPVSSPYDVEPEHLILPASRIGAEGEVCGQSWR